MEPEITPDMLLYAYRNGYFPMADPDEDDTIYWYAPDPRAILPLEAFNVSKNLLKLVRSERFEVVSDRDFSGVIRACSARASTWISSEIIALYEALHERGFAHSVECWQEGRLVGGLYGVALGGVFFGESMFYEVRDASKVALVHLVRRLRRQGYVLLDVQMSTPHLDRFGVIEIPREAYERRLQQALTVKALW